MEKMYSGQDVKDTETFTHLIKKTITGKKQYINKFKFV